MLTRQTEQLLARFLIQLGDGERRVETVRQTLAEQPLFHPYSVFGRLDKSGNGFLSRDDLADFLRVNSVFPTEGEVTALFKAWDSDRDGRISCSDFMEAVLPAANRILRTSVTGRSPPSCQKLPFDVEYALIRVIHQELAFLRAVEVNRIELARQYDFSQQRAFDAVDSIRLGYLNPHSLKIFLKRVGEFPLDNDLDAMMRRLDKDGDDRICFAEFQEALMVEGPMYVVSGCRKSVGLSLSQSSTPIQVSHTTSFQRPTSPLRPTTHIRSFELSPSRSYYYTPQPRFEQLRFSLKYYSPGHQMTSSTGLRSSSPLRTSLSPDRESTPMRSYFAPKPYQSDYKPHVSLGSSLTRDETSRSVEQLRIPASPLKLEEVTEEPTNTTPEPQEKAFSEIHQHEGVKQDSAETEQIQRCSTPDAREVEAFYASATEEGKNLLSSTEKPLVRSIDTYATSSSKAVTLEVSQDNLQVASRPAIAQSFARTERLNFDDPRAPDLVQLFMTQVSLDKEVEAAKQELAMCRGFNFVDGFKVFDIKQQGFIAITDLEAGLKDMGMRVDQTALFLLFRRFDRDADGQLRYADWLDMVSSAKPEYTSMVKSRLPVTTDTSATDQLLALFETYLKMEAKAETLRTRLFKDAQFKVHDAFSQLDEWHRTFLTQEDLRRYLQKKGEFITPQWLKGLMDRYDRDRDGRITYSEFVAEVSPKTKHPS